MRPFNRLCLALALLSSPSLLAQSGAKFYVSPTGSDNNSGSFTAPWRTIRHAANSAKAGATVYVETGIYHESVTFPASGTASEPITFVNYPGETPILDGTGLKPQDTQGLVNIVNQSYVTVQGFEIRNYTTPDPGVTPAGIWITGWGTGVRLLNNRVHHITTTAEGRGGNAFGIAVYGTAVTPISQLTISGNQVYSLKTGQSESVNVDGNVTHFTVTNNLIHDNDNIGFDAIGGEGVGPTGHDQASYGEVSGNTQFTTSAPFTMEATTATAPTGFIVTDASTSSSSATSYTIATSTSKSQPRTEVLTVATSQCGTMYFTTPIRWASP